MLASMDVLHDLAPVHDAYAGLPVGEAFDWATSGSGLGTGEWYLVAFRSVRKPEADEARLALYDEFAHQEAAGAPGFVHYYKGPTCPDGTCLSFCLWASRAEARAAAGRPAHVQAVGLLGEMYATYTLEFLRVRREHGHAPLEFMAYDTAPLPGMNPDPVTGPPPRFAFQPDPLAP